MENISPPACNNSELQALIAAIPHDLSITSTKTNSSLGDLSSTSSSCIFPQFNDMNAISSMLSLGGYPAIFNGFPMISTLPYLGPPMPPHATIESLGLINSALYQQQRDIQSAMCSPSSSTSSSQAANASQYDTRPRAFSSAATLQHSKPERRKRSRKSEAIPLATSSSSSSTTSTANTSQSTNNNNNSLLRSLVEDDDVTLPNKVRPIRVTKEEEEMVRQKTKELLETVPIRIAEHDEPEVADDRRPLRRLIRDEDLPDVVGPDSPFRHYPKYQPQTSTQLVMLQGIQAAVARLCVKAFELGAKSEQELAELRDVVKGQTLSDLINETIHNELIAAE